jgi:hypothetical protein
MQRSQAVTASSSQHPKPSHLVVCLLPLLLLLLLLLLSWQHQRS